MFRGSLALNVLRNLVFSAGNNVFGNQFERVLPASSAANLYPLNYSGKTDENGFYIGRDKYGSYVLVDLGVLRTRQIQIF